MLRIAAVAVLVLCAGGAARAQLSDTEQRIAAAVKQRSPAALELLERAVRINSGTLNPEGVRATGEVFRAEFESLGFGTRWVELPPEVRRAGHLVASHPGRGGKRLLLLGHLDTVFEKGSSVTLWERRGERVRGQGVNDMKGGDVVIVEALRALHSAGALQDMQVEVLLTGDEESTGRPRNVSRAALHELARRSDYALSFEGSGRQGGRTTAVVGRRAIDGWTLHVSGKPGHSMRVFAEGVGYGAIYEGARVLNAFREQLVEPNLTFNVGVVAGGTDAALDPLTARGTVFGKSNVIAREFHATGDLRYLTPEQGARAKQRMREIASASLPGAQTRLLITESRPPMPPTDAGMQLLALYSRASEDTGFGPVVAADPVNQGAGDIQDAAPYVAGIDGLGTTGSGSHTDDEDLEIASLERAAIRAAIFMYRLARTAP